MRTASMVRAQVLTVAPSALIKRHRLRKDGLVSSRSAEGLRRAAHAGNVYLCVSGTWAYPGSRLTSCPFDYSSRGATVREEEFWKADQHSKY
uniref:Secreted protein n=1 Tax=Steinernema glaseri TaxID=37863 RepID=A0A1I7ZYJ9_9BILA